LYFSYGNFEATLKLENLKFVAVENNMSCLRSDDSDFNFLFWLRFAKDEM